MAAAVASGQPERAGPTGPDVPRGRFSAGDRLLHRNDFRRTLRKGRRAQGPHFVLVAARGPGPRSRLGLAVSRGAGHAPARARLRRLLREAFRTLRHDLPRPVDLVVLAQKPWPDAGLADVLAETRTLARQLRLFGPPGPQSSLSGEA